MSMESYEERRETGWKTFYGGDPTFEHGESPAAKVISYFCKRKTNEPEVNLTNNLLLPEEPCYDYEYQVEVVWMEFHLKRVLRGKKKFYGNADLYKYVVLQDYVTQCKLGGYKKALISWQELALLKPRAKK